MNEAEEKALLDRVAKTEEQVAGQEKLAQQHKQEIGDARKEFQTALEATTDVVKKAELQVTLDKLKELEDTVSSKIVPGNQEKPGENEKPKTLDELQKALLDTVKSNPKLDEIWKKMPEAKREEVWNDPESLPQFIQAASEVKKPVPGSLLEAAAATGPGDQKLNGFRELFGTAAKQANHVPGGAPNESSGFAGAGADKGEQGQGTSRRLPGGVIPKPSQGQ